MIDRRFVRGLVLKASILGVVATGLSAFFWSTSVALGIFAGCGVTVANFAMFSWTIGRLLEAAKRGESTAVYGVLLAAKTVLLLAGVWWLLGTIDPLGFALGFSVFLPAMIWQVITGPLPKRMK